ncbi:hypothetical protein [Silvimonas sp.]|uniref:hypothetical protein n=1 Tax=Silvimonas sp. TaxID=2650811 RepID=UPI002842EA7B|nr:hypothetical protein [Silvimonas sp.]MDR3427944.1 hypothetical protein [Silvimonas sp.]
MSLPAQLFAALRQLAGDRCFPEQIPQSNKDWPAIFYRITGTPQNTIGGDSDQDVYRVEINLIDRSTDKIWALRRPVFDAIDFAFDSAERITDLPAPYDDSGALFRRVIEYYVRSE